MAVSVFFVIGALGLLIGPGIAGGATVVLGATFTLGGNLGGAKLILVAKFTGGLVVVDVLVASPLVNLEVPFVVALLNGFFAGTAEIGRLEGLDAPLVNGCLPTKGDWPRCVKLVLGVGGVFVTVVGFGAVVVFGDGTGVVLVELVRVAVGVVLAEVGRDAGLLGANLGDDFVTVVAFNVVVFGAIVGRTLVLGLEVAGAVVCLGSGFDVVVDVVVFLRRGADVLEATGFVEVVFAGAVLALETVVSNFLGADFLEAKLAPTAAIPAAPTTAATATSVTWNVINYY